MDGLTLVWKIRKSLCGLQIFKIYVPFECLCVCVCVERTGEGIELGSLSTISLGRSCKWEWGLFRIEKLQGWSWMWEERWGFICRLKDCRCGSEGIKYGWWAFRSREWGVWLLWGGNRIRKRVKNQKYWCKKAFSFLFFVCGLMVEKFCVWFLFCMVPRSRITYCKRNRLAEKLSAGAGWIRTDGFSYESFSEIFLSETNAALIFCFSTG